MLRKPRVTVGLLTAVCCSLLGLAFIGFSGAASYSLHRETESGTVDALGRAVVIDTTGASNGSAVRFTSASNPPHTPAARFPGDPNPLVTGKAYWGEAYAGNGDVKSRHENIVGKSVSIRRTFYSAWPAPASLFSTVTDDHANNRLPFVSVKLPSWSNAAAGQYNAQIDDMLRKLDAEGKPVWLAVHHEPEGGGGSNTPDDAGGPVAWRGMQTVIRQRLDAVNAKNVAFMPILMAYTWNPASGRNPNDWWVPNIWDAYIVDHYNDTESGGMIKAPWVNFAAWAEDRNIPFGTGEWGNRGTDVQAANEMREFWEWGFDNDKDVIAHTYFDSGLNSPNGSWELTGEPLATWRDILKNDTRVKRIND